MVRPICFSLRISSTSSLFLLSSFVFADKTVKLWKISEKTKRAEGYNLRDDNGTIRSTNTVTNLRIPMIRFEVAHDESEEK